MSKKRFSSGFDSLFAVENDAPQVATTQATPPSVADLEAEVKKAVMRKTTGKNFTSDLDTLFQEAFTEVVEEKVEKLRRDTGIIDPFDEGSRNSTRRPLSGLDALIRQTVDTSLAGLEHAAVKRLTIMFENQKIERLKTIAKQERSFVKDLVSNVLTEFIEKYERQRVAG
jgi:hypothetical protein